MALSKHEQENQRWAEECEYLARLLESKGNSDVPRESIPSYFRTQAAGAARNRFHCLASTLEETSYYVKSWMENGQGNDIPAILRAHGSAIS